MTFNSMLLHMLHGRFDVDAAAVGGEGYRRGASVYAYFGPFCAFVRLPFMAFVDLRQTDLTVPSMLLATLVAAVCKWRCVVTVRSAAPPSPLRDALTSRLLLVLLLAGAQIQFLRPSIYQEVLSWSNAEASGFILLACVGLFRLKRFPSWLMAGMAALAGVALLTRVTTGLGLYTGVGCLLLRNVVVAGRAAGWRRSLLSRSTWSVADILLMFAGAAAVVNANRWGNPLTFINLDLYVGNPAFPERVAREHRYGEFNLLRLPFGLLYYFVPIWFFPNGSGGLIFGDFQQRLIDSAEFPPASFLLSDSLLVILGFLGVRRLPGRHVPVRQQGERASPGLDRGAATILLGGFIVAPVLLLTAISMAFRYRVEFYPLLEFSALIGTFLWCHGERRSVPRWPAIACDISILAALVLLFAYRQTELNPITEPWGAHHLHCPTLFCGVPHAF